MASRLFSDGELARLRIFPESRMSRVQVGGVVRPAGVMAVAAGLASVGLVTLIMADSSPSPTWWVKVTCKRRARL
jgi:hypothetical protein